MEKMEQLLSWCMEEHSKIRRELVEIELGRAHSDDAALKIQRLKKNLADIEIVLKRLRS